MADNILGQAPLTKKFYFQTCLNIVEAHLMIYNGCT